MPRKLDKRDIEFHLLSTSPTAKKDEKRSMRKEYLNKRFTVGKLDDFMRMKGIKGLKQLKGEKINRILTWTDSQDKSGPFWLNLIEDISGVKFDRDADDVEDEDLISDSEIEREEAAMEPESAPEPAPEPAPESAPSGDMSGDMEEDDVQPPPKISRGPDFARQVRNRQSKFDKFSRALRR